jgi:hypothetical protein
MAEQLTEYRMDKSHFSVARLEDESDELAYWLSKTPEERLRAAEFIRQCIYGYDPAILRLQRVFEVVELKWS